MGRLGHMGRMGHIAGKGLRARIRAHVRTVTSFNCCPMCPKRPNWGGVESLKGGCSGNHSVSHSQVFFYEVRLFNELS